MLIARQETRPPLLRGDDDLLALGAGTRWRREAVRMNSEFGAILISEVGLPRADLRGAPRMLGGILNSELGSRKSDLGAPGALFMSQGQAIGCEDWTFARGCNRRAGWSSAIALVDNPIEA